MKTAVVISDTHGHKENLSAIARVLDEADYIFHLGDGRFDMREIEEKYPEKVYTFKGNCDLCGGLREAEIEIEGVKIFACHGDMYRVKSEPFTLAEEAKSAARKSRCTGTRTTRQSKKSKALRLCVRER